MISYNVFFNPNSGTSSEEAAQMIHAFFEALKKHCPVSGYRILHITNRGNFEAMPDFQVIVDFLSQEALDTTFAFMHEPGRLGMHSHGDLMRMAQDFKVSFTKDM